MKNLIVWNSVDTLIDKNNIELFFKSLGYMVPNGFGEIVINYNSGHPEPCTFNTNQTKEHVFEYLLSFNKEDKISIFKYNFNNIEGLSKNLIPFAIDPFGNYICFDFENREEPIIVFWLHETSEALFVANSFTEFLDKLY